MRISFVKSGGIAGAMTRVEGSVEPGESGYELSGDAGYRRTLTSEERAMLQAGAAPEALTRAAQQLAALAPRDYRDVEHYTVTVETVSADHCKVSLQFNPAVDLSGVQQDTVQFFSWLQLEAQRILTAKMKGR